MFNWLASKWKKFDIVKTIDGEQVLYLRRYFIWRCKWFNIYLHNIVRPDEDPDPHDHPWNFFSIVLKGGYFEAIFTDCDNCTIDFRGWRTRTMRIVLGEFLPKNILGYRSAETVHQIVRVLPNTWTLVFTGPWKRDWGFLTKQGWTFWREYLNCWEKVEMD